jgi:hypothetical protein
MIPRPRDRSLGGYPVVTRPSHLCPNSCSVGRYRTTPGGRSWHRLKALIWHKVHFPGGPTRTEMRLILLGALLSTRLTQSTPTAVKWESCPAELPYPGACQIVGLKTTAGTAALPSTAPDKEAPERILTRSWENPLTNSRASKSRAQATAALAAEIRPGPLVGRQKQEFCLSGLLPPAESSQSRFSQIPTCSFNQPLFGKRHAGLIGPA